MYLLESTPEKRYGAPEHIEKTKVMALIETGNTKYPVIYEMRFSEFRDRLRDRLRDSLRI